MKDKEVDLPSFAAMQKSCLKAHEGTYYLDKKHEYFFQVQLQMFCTDRKYCDFVVWSKHTIHINRVYIDEQFLKENLLRAALFHANVITPELLSKWYTETREALEVELWCHCVSPDDNNMIHCANENCSIQWFHKKCVDIGQVPEGSFWFFTACSVLLIPKIVQMEF